MSNILLCLLVFFFLGEYVSIWTVCCLNVIFFWGGFLAILDYQNIILYALKVIALVVTFIWVRGSVPRYRYDQLMRLGWKILLPISLGFVILYAGIYYELLYWRLEKLYLEDNISFSDNNIINVTKEYSCEEIVALVREMENIIYSKSIDELSPAEIVLLIQDAEIFYTIHRDLFMADPILRVLAFEYESTLETALSSEEIVKIVQDAENFYEIHKDLIMNDPSLQKLALEYENSK